MTLDEMLNKVNAINAQVAEKNVLRNQSIGKRDTLAEKFSSMVASYKEKYGVDLSNREAMDAEISKVLDEKEEETAILSQALALIDANKYIDAERLLTGTTETDEEIKRIAMERAQKEELAKAEAKEERAEVRETVKEIKGGNVTVATPDVEIPNVPVAPAPVEMPTQAPTMVEPVTEIPAPVAPIVPETVAEIPAPMATPTESAGADKLPPLMDELKKVFDTSPVNIPNQNVGNIPVPTAPPVFDTVPAVPNAVASPAPAPAPVASQAGDSVASAVNMFSTPSAPTSGTILSGVDDFMNSMGMGQPSAPVASPTAQPTAEKPKSFDAIFGGTPFSAGN